MRVVPGFKIMGSGQEEVDQVTQLVGTTLCFTTKMVTLGGLRIAEVGIIMFVRRKPLPPVISMQRCFDTPQKKRNKIGSDAWKLGEAHDNGENV